MILGIIDSGIDYLHPDFRNEDGSTRILYLWDQDQGQVYDREDINRALAAYGEQNDRRAALNIVPSVDVSGHGTAAAAIAAGNGRGSDGVYRGVAYESELIAVKLGTPPKDSFPRTTQLMEGLDFIVDVSVTNLFTRETYTFPELKVKYKEGSKENQNPDNENRSEERRVGKEC